MTATQTMDKTNERLAFAKQQLGQTEVGNAQMLSVCARMGNAWKGVYCSELRLHRLISASRDTELLMACNDGAVGVLGVQCMRGCRGS